MNKDSFFDSVRQKADFMPARQKKVCAVIVNYYQEAAFMTVEQLAETAGVGVATVVRATRALGFLHYSDLSSRLRGLLIKRESFIWGEAGNFQQDSSDPEVFSHSVFQGNIESIKHSHTEDLPGAITACVAKIQSSQKVAVLGLRSTLGIATYFASMLMEFRPHVSNIGLLGSDSLFASLADFSKEDLLLAISLGSSRHARRTLDAAQFAYENGTPVIAIVRDYTHPIIKYAEIVLCAHPAEGHYSVVSAVTILEAVIAALARQDRPKAQEKIDKLSHVLARSGVTT